MGMLSLSSGTPRLAPRARAMHVTHKLMPGSSTE